MLLHSGYVRHNVSKTATSELFKKSRQIGNSIFGLQVERLIEHARQVSIDKQRESSSNCALFVCNKWDQVPSVETDEVKNHIMTKLTQCWPSLDPESQIIYMSARDASEAQKLGVVTEEFAKLMNGIKSMVLKSIEARLQIQWR